MLLIDRYILRELLPSFGLAIVVTTCVLFVDKLLWLTTLILRTRLDLLTSWRLLCYTLPTVSGLTLPIAFLMGCTLTFNRLSMDSEYVALKTAGISLYRMLVPLGMAAVVVYGLSSVVLMYVSPWGFQGMQGLFFEVAHSRAHYHLRTHEFNDTFRGLVLYVERTVPELQRLEGVFIADTRSDVSQVITAQRGELLTEPDARRVVLRLEQGTIHRYAPPFKRYHLLHFGRYDVVLDLDTYLTGPVRDESRPRELFPSQFGAEMARRQELGKDPRELLLFWHKLFALPFAAIIFAGLGPVLGVVHPKSGRSAGYVLGLAALFVYYIMLTASDALAEATPVVPAFLAAWLPNVCMGSLTLWLVRRTARDAPPLQGGWLGEVGSRLWRWAPGRRQVPPAAEPGSVAAPPRRPA